jgi:hypothetical protein
VRQQKRRRRVAHGLLRVTEPEALELWNLQRRQRNEIEGLGAGIEPAVDFVGEQDVERNAGVMRLEGPGQDARERQRVLRDDGAGSDGVQRRPPLAVS